ncbi:MAG: acylneuraminate cytidylyltransferase [Oscillospiraceae bacterium]|nr:acylneuraminate cytidylyltransferase [Oscillospiraceae bacterium]
MNVAFIPVRGGSKSIPLKNIKIINGKPLVYWTVRAAQLCKDIDVVYVATDSDIIKETVESFTDCPKVKVIGRSPETASDTASTESAMLEFCNNYEFDNIVLIQATSPLLSHEDLDKGFDVFNMEDTDSVLSVVRQKRFNWAMDENGFVTPTNYDVFRRPRRQEFDGYLVENGAFYISSREGVLKHSNRIWGNIRCVEMNEDTFFEIDEPSDWVIIEALMKKNGFGADVEKKTVKMMITDCDGCLTDGGMYYSENGDELKKFNTRDGMAFGIRRKKGIICGIVTGEDRELNKRRAAKLKLDFIKNGISDKLTVVKELAKEYNISLDEIAYVGDDINDIDVIKAVGYSFCPADAFRTVKKHAHVLTAKGGEGVIREVIGILGIE